MQHGFFPFRIHEYLRLARRHVGPAAPATNVISALPPVRAKSYPRMVQIALEEPGALAMTLADALAQRRSEHEYGARQLNRADIATLFGHALKARAQGLRPYPSGGALFPIEAYLFVRDIDGIPQGIHHYHPEKHVLEHLWDAPQDFLDTIIPDSYATAWARKASALVVFTGVWPRTAVKYGDFGYYLGLLETGHMAQNVLLTATAAGIAACPMGGFNDEPIAQLLDIDHSSNEQVISIIAVGPSVET